jgi:multidrug efflux pump subunit AcrB
MTTMAALLGGVPLMLGTGTRSNPPAARYAMVGDLIIARR